MLNFALNFEYLGAEFYLRALYGTGLAMNDITGAGLQGTVTAGGPVPFRSAAIPQYIQRLAVDELAHVRFIKAVLGSAAVAEPSINLASSWTALATGAGLITPGQTFSPYTDEISCLLGAYVLEGMCVIALAGAARLLTAVSNIAAAATLLTTEGYHGGAVCTLLSDLGAGAAADSASSFHRYLSGYLSGVANDANGIGFRRTTTQVLGIAYFGAAGGGGFFPDKVNGMIA